MLITGAVTAALPEPTTALGLCESTTTDAFTLIWELPDRVRAPWPPESSTYRPVPEELLNNVRLSSSSIPGRTIGLRAAGLRVRRRPLSFKGFHQFMGFMLAR